MLAVEEVPRPLAEEATHRAIEVRLVVKPGVMGELGQAVIFLCIEQSDYPVYLEDLAEELWTRPDDLGEPAVQVSLRNAYRLADIGDPDGAACRLQHVDGRFDRRIGLTALIGETGEEPVHLAQMLALCCLLRSGEHAGRDLVEVRSHRTERRHGAGYPKTRNVKQPVKSGSAELARNPFDARLVPDHDIMIEDLSNEVPAGSPRAPVAIDGNDVSVAAPEAVREIYVSRRLWMYLERPPATAGCKI